MEELFIIATSLLMAIVFWYWGYWYASKKGRVKLKAQHMEDLITIRNKNSAHEPLDQFLTQKINEMMIDVYEMKRKRR
jgi:hypothetical protein